MATKVVNNVVGNRLIDNDRVCEDITSITLPDIKRTTSTISASGMVMDVDVPTPHLDAAEFSVAHNNGVNCRYLANPGKHTLEVRAAIQEYNVPAGEIGYKSHKYRVTGMHKETTTGTIENNNPQGRTDKYSVMRYEEIVDGEVVTCIDAAAGVLIWNGKDYAEDIDSLLK